MKSKVKVVVVGGGVVGVNIAVDDRQSIFGISCPAGGRNRCRTNLTHLHTSICYQFRNNPTDLFGRLI